MISYSHNNILLITIAVIIVVVGNIVTFWIFSSIGTPDYVVYLGCFLSAFVVGIVGSLLYKGKLFTKWIILSAILILVILFLIMIIFVFSVEDQPISSLKDSIDIFGFIFAIEFVHLYTCTRMGRKESSFYYRRR